MQCCGIYLELDALLIDMEGSRVPLLYVVKQKRQEFSSMDRALPNLLSIVNRNSNNLAASVVTSKRNPDAIPVARDFIEVFSHTNAVKKLGSIYPNAQASPNFLVLWRLLVYVDDDTSILGTVVVNGQSSAKAANAAANNGDMERELLAWHVWTDYGYSTIAVLKRFRSFGIGIIYFLAPS